VLAQPLPVSLSAATAGLVFQSPTSFLRRAFQTSPSEPFFLASRELRESSSIRTLGWHYPRISVSQLFYSNTHMPAGDAPHVDPVTSLYNDHPAVSTLSCFNATFYPLIDLKVLPQTFSLERYHRILTSKHWFSFPVLDAPISRSYDTFSFVLFGPDANRLKFERALVGSGVRVTGSWAKHLIDP